MKTQTVPINEVKSNPNNPRIIKDDKFKKLVASIKELFVFLCQRYFILHSFALFNFANIQNIWTIQKYYLNLSDESFAQNCS